jgi:hypothetical protein
MKYWPCMQYMILGIFLLVSSAAQTYFFERTKKSTDESAILVGMFKTHFIQSHKKPQGVKQ